MLMRRLEAAGAVSALGFAPYGMPSCEVMHFSGALGCEADLTFVRKHPALTADESELVRSFCVRMRSCGPNAYHPHMLGLLRKNTSLPWWPEEGPCAWCNVSVL